MRLAVKVVPGSSRSGVAGWLGEVLKVRVSAPAQGGKANAALEAVLAEALGVAPACVRVVAGWSSPRKRVEIDGISESELARRLPGRGLDQS
jgi:uncharacterized protein (TIGR00251 family)